MISQLLVSDSSKKTKEYVNREFGNKSEHLLIEIHPEKTEYNIHQIKEIIRDSYISNSMTKIYLLENFDSSSLEAQNAFLKLLEEPPSKTIFLLTVRNEYSLLATVVSRLHTVNLIDRVQSAPKSLNVELLNKLIDAKHPMIDEPAFTVTTKESALDVMNTLILFFRNTLTNDKKASTILKEIVRVYSLVENNNLNPQLSIDHLLIFIHKQYSMKVS